MSFSCAPASLEGCGRLWENFGLFGACSDIIIFKSSAATTGYSCMYSTKRSGVTSRRGGTAEAGIRDTVIGYQALMRLRRKRSGKKRSEGAEIKEE